MGGNGYLVQRGEGQEEGGGGDEWAREYKQMSAEERMDGELKSVGLMPRQGVRRGRRTCQLAGGSSIRCSRLVCLQVDLSQREDDEVCVAMREEQRALGRQMGQNGVLVEEVVAAVEGKRAEEER